MTTGKTKSPRVNIFFFSDLLRLRGYTIYMYKHNCAKIFLQDEIQNLHFRCPICLKNKLLKKVQFSIHIFPYPMRVKMVKSCYPEIVGG